MSRGSLPLTVGLYDGDKPYANVGSVINRGWDGNFSFNQNIGNVSLTIRANATYSDNEILEKMKAISYILICMKQVSV